MTRYEEKILSAALRIAERRLHYGPALTDPHLVRDYLRLWAAGLTEEAFGVIWLNAKHQVIKAQVLFHGTIDGTSVYPRVVVRAGLACNAAAALLFHNHPSGHEEPSLADRALTTRLKTALELVDIRTLDHLVVGSGIASFAEQGLI